MTRTLLGVRLDVDDSGDWSMVRKTAVPASVRLGERVPDLHVFGPHGPVTLHQLCNDSFIALHVTDARRRPPIPRSGPPGLRHVVVSRWDAPHDSGLRDRSYFDPGDRVRSRLSTDGDVVVLLRPDCHVALLEPWTPDAAARVEAHYLALMGRTSTPLKERVKA